MAYSDIKDPSEHFQTTLYTGAGANTVVTNGGNSDLKPDFLWIKRRNAGYGHVVVDSNRGLGSSNPPYLATEATDAENSNQNWISGVGTDGFTIGINEQNLSNTSGTYVAWQWKANGGTTASNSDGSVTSTVQANQDAGFSIVTFTSAASGVFSVGHGLGVLPAMIIVKNREATSQWRVWHKDLTNSVTSVLSLNRTDAEENYSEFWGAGVTSSVFGSKTGMSVDASDTYLAYCFAEKQGYSKFGSYVGNGNDNGPSVYTGFKPAFLMMKESSSAGGNWVNFDNKRDVDNVLIHRLHPNTTAGDNTSRNYIDFYSNGFKMRNTDADHNQTGETMVYMAIAENPCVAGGVPTTAR